MKKIISNSDVLELKSMGFSENIHSYHQIFNWFTDNYSLRPIIKPIKFYPNNSTDNEWCVLILNKVDENVCADDNTYDYDRAVYACVRNLIEVVKSEETSNLIKFVL